MNPEGDRLGDCGRTWDTWRLWGPYLAERAWGTVREDYSPDGSAWQYFPHDHARSRAYRWNEDGLLGICDNLQHLCFALAMWNGRDPIIKERLFGLTGVEGNHGEDVKEVYYYLDSTPTHSWMEALYRYPHAEYPYGDLVAENARRDRTRPEYELFDTRVFDDNRFFDVVAQYAKNAPDDILISISVRNRGPEAATLDLAPMFWFRNTWIWTGDPRRPRLSAANAAGCPAIRAEHAEIGAWWLICDTEPGTPELLFCDNETNVERLFPGGQPISRYPKDSINNYIVNGVHSAVSPDLQGTRSSALWHLNVPGRGEVQVRLRLCRTVPDVPFGRPFSTILNLRRSEADQFYADLAPAGLSDDALRVQRQAFAGLLWCKQFYHYNVRKWLVGDSAEPAPAEDRWRGRNCGWQHINNVRVMTMPDTWEYPWYAAWDLAFHCIPISLVDPQFAKGQLILLLREWFMHPNGQLPAYEWSFGDVNPPVHAWAAMRVFQIDRKATGKGDRNFLERVFHKLLLNFTWWVNRKDSEGNNVFQGGFLGLDNIGIFDRSQPLPTGGHLDQSDGTSWMAMYCLNMLAMAIELAVEERSYEDLAIKFLEHFFYISHAMNARSSTHYGDDVELWDEELGFYCDVMHLPDGTHFPLQIRSMVGLVPLLGVATLDPDVLERLPDLRRRLDWFIQHRPDLCSTAASLTRTGAGERRIFTVVAPDRLRRILTRAFDPAEFLAPTGIRSLSRYHLENPYTLALAGREYRIDYEAAESTTAAFGGNSNWRGPVWFPLNYLIIEALQKYDYYYGSDFQIEFPTGSGKLMNLWEVSVELSRRLISTFTRRPDGTRPVFGANEVYQKDPLWRDNIPFYEYYNGDTGAGLGASHQTGWTALVAKLIQQSGQ
ncbi:MAG: glucosidase [Armatimonadetes bacterium]|nr:glucosidase [Armatimonadota bacterium]MDE2206611.1 glucosidase [Armatimonadota bacterium]